MASSARRMDRPPSLYGAVNVSRSCLRGNLDLVSRVHPSSFSHSLSRFEEMLRTNVTMETGTYS